MGSEMCIRDSSKSLSHGATVLKEVAEGTTLGPQLSVYHHMKSHHALFWTPDIGPLTATSDDDMAKIVDLAVREASTSDAAQLHKNGTPSCFHSVYRADIRLNGAFTGACEKTIKHEHQLIRNLSFTVTDGGAYALQWLVTSHKWIKGNHSRDKDFAPELSWSNFPTQPQSHPCTAEEVLNPPAHPSPHPPMRKADTKRTLLQTGNAAEAVLSTLYAILEDGRLHYSNCLLYTSPSPRDS